MDSSPGSGTPKPRTSNPAEADRNGAVHSPAATAEHNGSQHDRKRRPGDNDTPENDQQHQSGPANKRKRIQERHQARRRGRTPPASVFSRRNRSRSPSSATPRDDYSRRSRSPLPRRSPEPEEQPKQRKRPGGGARAGLMNSEQLRRRQEERERAMEEDAMRTSRDRGVSDVVRQHYNAVPERGREWRKTESKIKGLRSFNNWVKSTLIQKFSPDEEFAARFNDTKDWADDSLRPNQPEEKQLLVLDLGCGKGGDLGKWQLAPQKVELYVGLDPANISIEQARDRYGQMRSRGGGGRGRRPPPALFHAEFATKDCFGESLADVNIIQRVGFDPNAGPGGSLMASRWGGGGFDVVTSMFAIHYAFESEEKTRQMLSNVAGCLKKGGRFIGVCPNSDVITNKVSAFHKKRKEQEAAKPAESEGPEDGEVEEEERCGWGNDIYSVRFPGDTPENGIFRPPFGWKYTYFMSEAVEGVPEYVVPWEAFRALTEDYNLELQYRKPFLEIWEDEKNDRELGPLSERMGVRDRNTGELLMTEEEKDAVTTPRSAARETEVPADRHEPETPEYQVPEGPLSLDAHRDLHKLLEKNYLDTMRRHIHNAGANITHSAGEVSDRLRDAQTRYQKMKDKRRSEEDGQDRDPEEEDEQYQRLAEQERKVNSIMGRLEEKMRGVVDGETRCIELKEALNQLDKEEAQVQHVLVGDRQLRSNRRTTRRMAEADEENEEDEEDAEREPTPIRELREQNAENPPSKRLKTTLAESQRKWEGLSLTQRYSKNNTYTGFYRVVHDSKYPDNEAPPLPHSSTWFSHMEDDSSVGASNRTPSNRRRTRRQPSPADSDDVAIERERISLNCPITLARFKDPVTSTKCPHSFEHDAIMDMIMRSKPMPGGPTRAKAIKCPVCLTFLTAADLVRDTALQRRVRRAEEREARRAEESGSEDDDERQNPNRVTLASDAVDPDEDAMDVDVPAVMQHASEYSYSSLLSARIVLPSRNS
ncbi:mRNA cap guanine-N7 methyltransferase [Penicillium rolfsii]|nr:mRNA cap guanine-N7 methyltransferase [Penicillium rolfsii]